VAGDGLLRLSTYRQTLAIGAGVAGFRFEPLIPSVEWRGAVENLRVQYGLRSYRWSEDDEEATDPKARLHTYRRALALRVTADIDAGENGHGGATDRALGTVFGHDSNRHAPGHHLTASAEARYEMVGCYAPFIHVQAGAGVSAGNDAVIRDQETNDLAHTAKTTFVVPLSVAAGSHLDVTTAADGTWPLTVYVEYALVAGRLPSLEVRDSGDPLSITPDTKVDALSRIRIGVEWTHSIRIGAAVDIQLGPVDGVFGAISMSLPWRLR
jgi:hypothetical protein